MSSNVLAIQIQEAIMTPTEVRIKAEMQEGADFATASRLAYAEAPNGRCGDFPDQFNPGGCGGALGCHEYVCAHYPDCCRP